jgi:hypothetical protein
VLDACIRHGYLAWEDGRRRVGRPSGDAYSELVGYATAMILTSRLRELLADICDRPACTHVPPVDRSGD